MKKIKVLGTECSKCNKLAENAEAAAKALGLACEIEKVRDINSIMIFDVMMTPALVIDGQVKVAGRVPSGIEIQKMLILMADPSDSCTCGTAPKLIFSCSGASDTGEIADRAARKLTREGIGKMFCLAGLGGKVSGIMTSTEAASRILAIDGCLLHCAGKTLEQAGFKEFNHLCLAGMGLEKGRSPVTDEKITEVAGIGKLLLTHPKI